MPFIVSFWHHLGIAYFVICSTYNAALSMGAATTVWYWELWGERKDNWIHSIHLWSWELPWLCCTGISRKGWKTTEVIHDVIKWKHFRVTGLLCRKFTGPWWVPHTKASDAELWCFLWSAEHENIIKLERDYKRTIQRKKREHRENVLRHLEDLDSNDPTEYWRFWKSLQNRTTQSDVIDASTFAGHYKANNSPPIYPDFNYANINEIKTLSCVIVHEPVGLVGTILGEWFS